MKKIIIVTISLLIVFCIVFLILNSKYYSQLEIDADNFEKKLSINKQGIYESNLEECIPDIMLPFQGLDIVAPGCKITSEQKSSTMTRIDVVCDHSNLHYIVWFDKKNGAIKCDIFKAGILEYEPQLKTICDKLMMKGFILKESRYIRASDILVKETEKSFLIVRITGKYQGSKPPMGLHIQSYSKKKYFN